MLSASGDFNRPAVRLTERPPRESLSRANGAGAIYDHPRADTPQYGRGSALGNAQKAIQGEKGRGEALRREVRLAASGARGGSAPVIWGAFFARIRLADFAKISHRGDIAHRVGRVKEVHFPAHRIVGSMAGVQYVEGPWL